MFLVELSDIEDGECESCAEKATRSCEECKVLRCQVCSDLWHKHPKRNWHNVKVNYIIILNDVIIRMQFKLQLQPCMVYYYNYNIIAQ